MTYEELSAEEQAKVDAYIDLRLKYMRLSAYNNGPEWVALRDHAHSMSPDLIEAAQEVWNARVAVMDITWEAE